LISCTKNNDENDIISSIYEGPRQLDFLAVDNGWMKLHRIDFINSNNWSTPVGFNPRDVQLLSNDRVIVSNHKGATIHDINTGKELQRFESYDGVESVIPSQDGFVIFEQNDEHVTMYMADIEGEPLHTSTLSGYTDLRLAQIVSGTTIDDLVVRFTSSNPYRIVVVQADGAERSSIPLEGKGYEVEDFDNEHILATTGDDACLDLLDDLGNELQTWGCETIHPDLGLDWSSGFDLIVQNHMLITNWLGGQWPTSCRI